MIANEDAGLDSASDMLIELAQVEASGLSSFLAENKEVVAAIGLLLGLLPQLVSVARDFTGMQRKKRQYELERQRLELLRMRYELIEYEQQHGKIGAGVIPAPGHPGAELLAQPEVEAEAGPPELVVELSSRFPRLGPLVLRVLQIVLVLLMLVSGFVAMVLPLELGNETEPFPISEFLITETIYVLMAAAFWALSRRLGRWGKIVAVQQSDETAG